MPYMVCHWTMIIKNGLKIESFMHTLHPWCSKVYNRMSMCREAYSTRQIQVLKSQDTSRVQLYTV